MPDKPNDKASDRARAKKKYNDLSKKLSQSKKSQNSLRSIRGKSNAEANYYGRSAATKRDNVEPSFVKPKNKAPKSSSYKKSQARLGAIILITAVVALLVASGYYALTYKNASEITVNGEPIAHIKTVKLTREDFIKSLTAVIEQIEETKIMITDDIGLELVHGKKKLMADDGELLNLMADTVNYKVLAARIAVDGVVIGTAANRAEADEILNAVKAPFTEGRDDILAEFVEDVSISDENVSKDEISANDFIRAELSKTLSSQFEYIVASGDMLSTIASSNGTTISEIKELNPDLDVAKPLQIGQSILLNSTMPYISVKTTETVVETFDIAMPVIEQPDPTLTSGQRRIIQPGSPGKKEVSTQVIKINGVVASKGEPQEKIVEQAVTQIVSVGTN